MADKRFWISWWSPHRETFPNPLPVPLWISGERPQVGDDSWDEEWDQSFCALVDAPTEAEAKLVVGRFASVIEWRFCAEKPADWLPGERFPLPKEEPCSESG